MKTVKSKTFNFSLLISLFLLFSGCEDQEAVEEKCKALSSDVDLALGTYSSSPNAANCQKVIEAYNKYINYKCDDAESYINSRDAFQKKNCP